MFDKLVKIFVISGTYMTKRMSFFCFLSLCIILFTSGCSVDSSGESGKKTLKIKRQRSFTGNGRHEITASNLKPGESSIGLMSLDVSLFSTTSVSNVAIYSDEGEVAAGSGVQSAFRNERIKHGDKIFLLRTPELTTSQAEDIRCFTDKVIDSDNNYRGMAEFTSFMAIRQLCHLNPFSDDFRQQ